MKIAILGPLPSTAAVIERAFPDDEVIVLRKADRVPDVDADLYVAWVRFITHPMRDKLRQMAGSRPFLQVSSNGVSGLIRTIRVWRGKA